MVIPKSARRTDESLLKEGSGTNAMRFLDPSNGSFFKKTKSLTAFSKVDRFKTSASFLPSHL